MSFKKFTADLGIVGITHILVSLSGLILVPVFTKTLGSEQYGFWVLFFALITLIKPFSEFGLSHAIVRFLPGEKDAEIIRENIFAILTVVLIAGLILYSFFVFLNKEIAQLFFEGKSILVFLFAILIPIWYGFHICENTFRALGQIKKYSIFKITDTYGKVGIATLLILDGYGLLVIITAYIIIKTVLLFIALLIIIKEFGISIPKFTGLKEYFCFSIPLIPSSLSGWIVHSSDRFMIAYFLGPLSVGYYNPAYSLGFLLFGLVSIVEIILTPTITKSYKKHNLQEVKNYLRYLLKYFLSIAIPFIIGSLILSKQILRILSTNEIAEEAYIVTPFIALGTMVLGIGVFFSQIGKLTKKTKIFGKVGIFSAVLNIILNILFIQWIGILGAAVATCVAFAFQSVTISYFASKDIKIGVEKKFILKAIIASSIMALLILIWNPSSLLNILLCIIICIIIYFSILIALGGFSKKEIEFAKNFLKKNKY